MRECSSCQAVNDDKAQFCLECGQKLALAARQSTIVAQDEQGNADPGGSGRPRLHSPILGGYEDSDEASRRTEKPRNAAVRGKAAHLRSPLLGAADDAEEFEEPEVKSIKGKSQPGRPGGGKMRSPLLDGGERDDDYAEDFPLRDRHDDRSAFPHRSRPREADPQVPAPNIVGKGHLRSPLLGGSDDDDYVDDQFPSPPGDRKVAGGGRPSAKLHSPLFDRQSSSGDFSDWDDDEEVVEIDDPNVLRSPLLAAKSRVPMDRPYPPRSPGDLAANQGRQPASQQNQQGAQVLSNEQNSQVLPNPPLLPNPQVLPNPYSQEYQQNKGFTQMPANGPSPLNSAQPGFPQANLTDSPASYGTSRSGMPPVQPQAASVNASVLPGFGQAGLPNPATSQSYEYGAPGPGQGSPVVNSPFLPQAPSVSQPYVQPPQPVSKSPDAPESPNLSRMAPLPATGISNAAVGSESGTISGAKNGGAVTLTGELPASNNLTDNSSAGHNRINNSAAVQKELDDFQQHPSVEDLSQSSGKKRVLRAGGNRFANPSSTLDLEQQLDDGEDKPTVGRSKGLPLAVQESSSRRRFEAASKERTSYDEAFSGAPSGPIMIVFVPALLAAIAKIWLFFTFMNQYLQSMPMLLDQVGQLALIIAVAIFAVRGMRR